ncbi:MAG: hypothetical protein JNL80_18560 [Phycisphaerae bacterium]|nr:hypothetical protein [Phycisphaerae bacterium]
MRFRRFRAWMAAATAIWTAAVALAQITPPTDFYVPPVFSRGCSDASDGVSSPTDARLDLPSGKGTIEFWLKAEWMGGDTRKPLYFVLGNNRYATDAPLPLPTPETGAGAADVVDPAFDPAATGAGKPTDGPAQLGQGGGQGGGQAGGAARQNDVVYAPRYAIYLSENAIFLQVGRKLWRQRLTQPVIEKLANHSRIHFVLVFDKNLLVYADGAQCAKLNGVPLPSTADDPRLGQAGNNGDPARGVGGSVLVGGSPVLTERDTVALFEPQVTRPLMDVPLSLSEEVRPLDGSIGGVRVWSRAFPTNFFEGTRSVLEQRGEEDIFRSLEFPSPPGSNDAPRLSELVAYSSFAESDAARHAILIQHPVSGRWVNDLRTETHPSDKPPPGLDDPYGNVDDYPLISIVPSLKPGHFYVYQDSSLLGILIPGTAPNTFEFTHDEGGTPMGCTVRVLESGKLDVRLSGSVAFFGGDKDGKPASRLTLVRPSLKWSGLPCNPSSGFFTQGFVKYYRTAYQAFDITKMDPLRAYQGETGTAQEVFKEPTSEEYFLDMNAGGTVVAFGFRYVGMDQGKARATATLTTDSAQLNQTLSVNVGTSLDIEAATGPNMSESLKTKNGGGSEHFTRTTESLSVARSFNKDFMITVNKSTARLNPTLVEDVEKLRAALMTDGPNFPALESECEWFIGRWGTHYSIATTFGGMLISTRTVKEEDIRACTESSLSLEANLRLGFAEKTSMNVGLEGVASATVDTSLKVMAGVEGGMETTSKEMAERLTSTTESELTTLPAGQTLGSASSEPGSHGYPHPVPIFFDLRPISELLSPVYFDDPVIYHAVRETLRRKTKEYIASRTPKMTPGVEQLDWSASTNAKTVSIRLVSFWHPKLDLKAVVSALLATEDGQPCTIAPTSNSVGSFSREILDGSRRPSQHTDFFDPMVKKDGWVSYDIVGPTDSLSEKYGANGSHRYALDDLHLLIVLNAQNDNGSMGSRPLSEMKRSLAAGRYDLRIQPTEDWYADVEIQVKDLPGKLFKRPRESVEKLTAYREYTEAKAAVPLTGREIYRKVIPVPAFGKPSETPVASSPDQPAPTGPGSREQRPRSPEEAAQRRPAVSSVADDGTVTIDWKDQEGVETYVILRTPYPGSGNPEGQKPRMTRFTASNPPFSDKPPAGKWIYRVFPEGGRIGPDEVIGVAIVTVP